MSWMNGCDVENCSPQTQVLSRGAEFLRSFMHLIDSISDGWAYWSYGTKCSSDLQSLVQTPPIVQRGVTEAQVKAAQRKVLLFLRRCRQTKDKPEVVEFLAKWGAT